MTIYEALKAKLGRKPTQVDVARILEDVLAERIQRIVLTGYRQSTRRAISRRA